MSLHRSLRTQPAALNQHRNVLTRAERITHLADAERFDLEKDSPMGLVKVANRQMVTKKKKAEAKEDDAAVEGGGEEAAPAS